MMDDPTRHDGWVAEPEVSDDAVRAATGRGWDEWRTVLDAWPGRDDGHTAIAAHVESAHGVDGWWAQTVAVGYERITGRRLPYQQPDGTFTVATSRTLAIDAAAWRARLLDPDARAALFPGLAPDLRSRPTATSLRFALDPGILQIAIDPRPDGRAKVILTHERLPTPDDVERWRAHWSAWLRDLEGR